MPRRSPASSRSRSRACHGRAGAAGRGRAAQAIADKSTTIWAEPETNALVITAPPKTMRSLMSVIDKLDIRRAQVLVEAIIVEVTADKSAELGVNWVADGSDGTSGRRLHRTGRRHQHRRPRARRPTTRHR
jgi:type II secretory pathway component GspD/PulD (secretin)